MLFSAPERLAVADLVAATRATKSSQARSVREVGYGMDIRLGQVLSECQAPFRRLWNCRSPNRDRSRWVDGCAEVKGGRKRDGSPWEQRRVGTRLQRRCE